MIAAENRRIASGGRVHGAPGHDTTLAAGGVAVAADDRRAGLRETTDWTGKAILAV